MRRSARCASTYFFGVTPTSFLNVRWKWNGERPATRASVASGTRSSACVSRNATARRTARTASGGSVVAGLQRRQARKPAASASAGPAKNRTFSRFGRRAAQDGRQ